MLNWEKMHHVACLSLIFIRALVAVSILFSLSLWFKTIFLVLYENIFCNCLLTFLYTIKILFIYKI
jgi:hypothetical protein